MPTLTVKPSNTLGIKIQKVKKAYLAKKEIKGKEKTGETYSYTFKGTNNTSTKTRKERIAKIIYKNIKGDLEKNRQQTTVDYIVEALKKDSYTKGDCIDVSLVLPKIEFNRLKKANLGDEVYMVVETENMAGREVKLNLKQAEEDCLQAKNSPVILQKNGEKVILVKTNVGKFTEENKKSILNAEDFKDYAIEVITLLPKDEERQKKYREALNKTTDKKTRLFMVVDAEPKNQNWFEVQYEEVVDNRPNLWYHGDGNWFEFSGTKVYKKGDKGKEVQEINIRLAGFGGNVPDEKFTDRTVRMVKQFQKDYMEIEPTGIVESKTLEAIKKFGKEFDIPFNKTKCPCGTCDGYGKGLYPEQKQSSSILEKKRKYEYPGIHRTLFWTLKATLFYLKHDDYSNYNLKFGKVSSGYRCHQDNKNHKRRSTNHMGKALDIHFYKSDNTISTEANCDKVRKIMKDKSGAQLRWSGKNKFSLEPSTKDRIGREFIATTWVHFDVRNFELKYLKDKFFIKSKKDITNEII